MTNPRVTLRFTAILLCAVVSLFAFAPAKYNSSLTPEELNAMPFSKFVRAGASTEILSCVVSLEEGVDVKEYSVIKEVQPDVLKAKFAQIKPGQFITVENRRTIEGGEVKKLPAILYSIVAK